MARGGPDWESPSYQLSGVQVDAADTADRLLGFARVDTRGRVFYLETFKDGLTGWSANTAGTATAPQAKVEAQRGFAGPVAIHLLPGATVGDSSFMTRAGYLGAAKRVGVEICLTLTGSDTDVLINLSYIRNDGVTYAIYLWYDTSAAQWYVRDNSNVDHALSLETSVLQTPFFIIKIVGDFETGLYDRVLAGEIQYNISDVTLHGAGTADEGKFVAGIHATSDGGSSSGLYLHYIIFTKDEE